MRDIAVVYYAAIAVATFSFLAIGLPEPKGPSPTECTSQTVVTMNGREKVICQQLRRRLV
jgi:hypothetical protein